MPTFVKPVGMLRWGMDRVLRRYAAVAAMFMLAACASETRFTAPQAYAPVERLDDLATEAAKREKRLRQSQANVQAVVDKMAAERGKPAPQ
jgi:hypothetical protein